MLQDATFYADDLMNDARWAIFGPKSVSVGVRCALAISLVVNNTPGALNLYARYPQGFGATDRAKAAMLATLGSLSLGGALIHEVDDRRADNLHMALGTRELIGQAQGILMEREQISHLDRHSISCVEHPSTSISNSARWHKAWSIPGSARPMDRTDLRRTEEGIASPIS